MILSDNFGRTELKVFLKSSKVKNPLSFKSQLDKRKRTQVYKTYSYNYVCIGLFNSQF